MHKEAKAQGGVSIPKAQFCLGWSTSILFYRMQWVGVRVWVDDGCLWSMGSGRARETAAWFCKGIRSSPAHAPRSPLCTFCTLCRTRHMPGCSQSWAWGGCLPSCRWFRTTQEHSYQATSPSTCLIQGVEVPCKWSQILQCFPCWKAKGHGQSRGTNIALHPGPAALQEKTSSIMLGLDPLSLLAASASREGWLAKPAKGSLQTQWSLQLIFSWPSEVCSPSSLQHTAWSLCHASQHQGLAVLGKETLLSQKRTEWK